MKQFLNSLMYIILLPFSLIYGIVVQLRRSLYNLGVFKRHIPAIHTLVVGNIEVGGTGKTPMVQWIANNLSEKLQLAVLSRGYGRNSKGFFEVFENSLASEVGDEPLTTKINQPNLKVFVGENRIEAIKKIKQLYPKIQLVIMDDGFQHLQLKAQLYLLLNNYNRPLHKGLPFPSGRQREFAFNKKEAQLMGVTKVPQQFSELQKNEFEKEINFEKRNCFYFEYQAEIVSLSETKHCVLVSGLANNADFKLKIMEKLNVQVLSHFEYPDHYGYTKDDAQKWADAINADKEALLITTQKDFVKIKALDLEWENRIRVASVTPKIKFVDEKAFFDVILNLLSIPL